MEELEGSFYEENLMLKKSLSTCKPGQKADKASIKCFACWVGLCMSTSNISGP